jgi:hypothetical protein
VVKEFKIMKEVVSTSILESQSLPSEANSQVSKANKKVFASCLSSRTAACKHNCEGCLENSLQNSGSKFLYAYLASNLFQAIP